MYILAVAFLSIFALGMMSCTIHLLRKNRELSDKNQALRRENAEIRVDNRKYKIRNRELKAMRKALTNTVHAGNTIQLDLRAQLDAAHRNLELVLESDKSHCVFADVAVEVSRSGINYVFTKSELDLTTAN